MADTDQFPNNTAEVALAFYHILKTGGFTTGGLNFDAKLRRQSLDPEDLLLAHIGGIDTCARGLMAAVAMIEDGALDRHLADRYAGWKTPEGQAMLKGDPTLEDIPARVAETGLDPQPVSGRQEYLENVVNGYL